MIKSCKRCAKEFTVSGPGHRYCASCKASCRVEGCEGEMKELGYCAMHYSRLRRNGELGPVESQIRSMNGQCMIVGCEDKVVCNSLCNMHYRRLLRTGELGPIERKRALVGSGVDAKGYRYINVNGHQLKEHRLVMERVLGRPLAPNENVHHLDGDRLNNDPSNLELWVKTQPCGQRPKDRVKAAISLLKQYPELLGDEGFRLLALESQEATELLEQQFAKSAGMLAVI